MRETIGTGARAAALLLVLGVALAGCVSTDSATQSSGSGSAAKPSQSDRRQYFGAAEAKGNTFLNARNQAIMAAVKNAVVDIIGAGAEEANRSTLETGLYNTKSSNTFIHEDSIQNVKRETRGEDNWYYELSVDVNLVAVRNTLKANGGRINCGDVKLLRSQDGHR